MLEEGLSATCLRTLLGSSVVKTKCSGVFVKEMYKAIDDDVTWP